MKDTIPVIDIAIWEMHGSGQAGKYQLAISWFAGGSITLGKQYTTKKDARAALSAIRKRMPVVFMDEQFGLLRAILARINRQRISRELENIDIL